jgi:phosphoglycerol transferase MdoB-like AlkP superfamily enzyme
MLINRQHEINAVLSALASTFLIIASMLVIPFSLRVANSYHIKSRTPSSLQARESRFARLKLPLGVYLYVPKNGRILDGDMNATIETAAEATMNLSGVDLSSSRKGHWSAVRTDPKLFSSFSLNIRRQAHEL